MGNRWRNSGNSVRLYFGGLQNHCRWWLQPWNLKTLTPWKEGYDQPRQHIQKQRHYFVNKGLSSQGYGFSSGHVWRWEFDCEESWAPKNWCFWTVVLEKTLESPLDCKEIQPVHPKADQQPGRPTKKSYNFSTSSKLTGCNSPHSSQTPRRSVLSDLLYYVFLLYLNAAPSNWFYLSTYFASSS